MEWRPPRKLVTNDKNSISIMNLVVTVLAASVCRGPIAVIPPADIPTLPSIGDRAIVTGAVYGIREQCPGAAIVIVGKVLPLKGINATIVKSWPNVARGASAIVALGTDVIDGRFQGGLEGAWLRLSRAATKFGTSFSIVSFTYAAQPNVRQRIEGFGPLTCLRPRSRVSCAHIRSTIEATEPNASVGLYPVTPPGRERVAHLRHTMDLAFLVEPTSPPLADARWLDEQLALPTPRTVLAINLYAYVANTTFRRLARIYSAELCAAHHADPSLSMLLVPHDFRWTRMRYSYVHEGHYLLDIAEQVASLCPTLPVRVFNDGTAYDPTQSRAALERVHGVVSGFMHFLIIAASAGAPGLSLTPLDKFYQLNNDLYPGIHPELAERLVIRNASNPGGLRDAICRFVPALGTLRAALQRQLPAVRRLSRLNLDALAGGGDGMCERGVALPCGEAAIATLGR
jgi:hypothetical protein